MEWMVHGHVCLLQSLVEDMCHLLHLYVDIVFNRLILVHSIVLVNWILFFIRRYEVFLAIFDIEKHFLFLAA